MIRFPLGDWSITEQHLSWLSSRLPENKTILELGSGNGTYHLCVNWKVFSVEHDPRFLHRHGSSTYIHAPIVDGWYDVQVLKSQLPKHYDLLIIDGPPGTIGRTKMLEHLDLFCLDVPIMVDDTHRIAERKIATELGKLLDRKPLITMCKDGRSFAVLDYEK